MKSISLVLTGFAVSLASPALAQNNPFMPPAGGMSKAQVQEIVRQEVERAKASAPKTSGPAGSGVAGQLVNGPTPGQIGGLPSSPGSPSANTAAGGGRGAQLAIQAPDQIAGLLKDGGSFIGCVGSTPVFKDKAGRRAYFTTKELRESNEARRYTRC